MKKRFIVLIDFSTHSGKLLKYAYDWSKQVNAELLLVHQSLILAPAMIDTESKESITQQTNNEQLQKLKEFAETVLSPTANVSYYVSEGHFELILTRLFSESFENLIFVGLKGMSLFKNIFIKSIVFQVIENTKNTIVAIPADIESFSQKKLFVAVPEKHSLNILELNRFLNFIDNKTTSIEFFRLAKPNVVTTELENQLLSLAKMYADKFKTTFSIYEGTDLSAEINKIVRNRNNEILIVQKTSLNLTDELFRKSELSDLVMEGQIQLIILS